MVLKAYNLMGLSAFLRHQVLRELDIHARLHHPSIVHLIAAFKVGVGSGRQDSSVCGPCKPRNKLTLFS